MWNFFILGALVDHLPKIGLSTEKAGLSGIRTARFPLDKYLNWCQGTQCLMLVQVRENEEKELIFSGQEQSFSSCVDLIFGQTHNFSQLPRWWYSERNFLIITGCEHYARPEKGAFVGNNSAQAYPPREDDIRCAILERTSWETSHIRTCSPLTF